MGNTIVFAKDRLIRLVGKSWVPRCELMNYCRRTHTWRFHREFEDSSLLVGVSFPQLEDAEIRCSNFGWLLMSRSDSDDRCTLFFFNPCSNRTIYLPPRIGPSYTTLFFTHPPTSPDCTVVGIGTPFVGLFVEICVLARGTEWERKKHPTKTRFSLSSGPPIMHRGQIYFLDVRGNVAMFDVINRRLVTTNKCLVSRHDDRIKEHYLFELNGDQVFGVFAFRDPGKVIVRRLSTRNTEATNKTKMRWEKVEEEDIGDNVVVYLSRVSSFSFPCTKKSMANRIYFPRLLHGCDSPVFYSLSDAKFHSGHDDNNAPASAQIKRLDHAAWVLTTPQLTATNFKTPCWKFCLLFLSLFSVSGFLTIIKKFRK